MGGRLNATTGGGQAIWAADSCHGCALRWRASLRRRLREFPRPRRYMPREGVRWRWRCARALAPAGSGGPWSPRAPTTLAPKPPAPTSPARLVCRSARQQDASNRAFCPRRCRWVVRWRTSPSAGRARSARTVLARALTGGPQRRTRPGRGAQVARCECRPRTRELRFAQRNGRAGRCGRGSRVAGRWTLGARGVAARSRESDAAAPH